MGNGPPIFEPQIMSKLLVFEQNRDMRMMIFVRETYFSNIQACMEFVIYLLQKMG